MTMFRRVWMGNKREDCAHKWRSSENQPGYIECASCGVMVEQALAVEELFAAKEALENRLAKLEARIAAMPVGGGGR